MPIVEKNPERTMSRPETMRVQRSIKSEETIPSMVRNSNTFQSSRPNTRTQEADSSKKGLHSLDMAFTSVDLPQPLGPRIAMFSPTFIRRDTSLTAVVEPRMIVTRSNSMSAGLVICELLEPTSLLPRLKHSTLEIFWNFLNPSSVIES